MKVNIYKALVLLCMLDHWFDGKLQLTKCQLPAYSVLRPIRIGVVAAL